MRKKRRQRMRWLLAVYLFVLIVLVIFKFNGSIPDLIARALQVKANRASGYMNYNLKFFATIRLYLRQLPQAYAWKNLIANILAFFPLGFLLPQSYRICRKFPVSMGISFLFLLSCEVLQLGTLLGSFDVDDILLNMIGVFSGYCCWRILYHRERARRRRRREARRMLEELERSSSVDDSEGTESESDKEEETEEQLMPVSKVS